ncbi:MAG: cupin domain-containing protein [Acidobacteria bacterium]|nr:MAG: cupin domain-containing protein [Acidobacteriota bacterium]
MLEQNDGWFVVNLRDATWYAHPLFGRRAELEREGRFPQTGIRVVVLEPGQPACRYHRENAQEDFLVLSGRCTLLVNDEQRELSAWDFVHCPPGVTHVFVGAGDGPCALLMIGHRPGNHELFYPESEAARRFGAEAPEPTSDPRIAYADVPRPEPCEPPEWPIGPPEKTA